MKTMAYLAGSFFISYIPRHCQFGEAAVTNNVLESSTVNSFPARIKCSSVSDGEFAYTTASLSKQYVSVSTHARKISTWRDSNVDTNTVDIQRTSVGGRIITTLTTTSNKETSVFDVTGQNEHNTITELDAHSGNTHRMGITSDSTLTVNDFVVTEAKTLSNALSNAGDSEQTSIKMTVQQQYSIVEKICDILYDKVDPVICMIGILCNIVSLIVLNDSMLSDSPYIYLTSLAITDIGVLVMALIFNKITGQSNEYAAVVFTTYVYFPFVNIFLDASIWVTCALTIERIIYIKTPLLARSVCTRKRAKCFISCICVFDVLINIPRFFVYRPFCFDDKWYYQTTTIMQSEIFSYISWSYMALINVLPLLILLMSNLYMVKLLHISTYKRQRMQPHLVRERRFSLIKGHHGHKLTLTLIIIVFIFIVCTFPSTFADLHVSHTLFGGNMNYTEYANTDLYAIITDASNTLLLMNCSLNFLLYCVFNDKFRTVLKNKMMCLVQKNKK
ncbi:hypothetical protein ACJMK2_003759 [Sinanodonta woodiana]|uniref:G-protein coupled receptors family 1 profile domain-containing protein n=1 Tax=Sinanodonta woodiana TaxID=1069815 RepID=A0ABD3Y1F4_SINWO